MKQVIFNEALLSLDNKIRRNHGSSYLISHFRSFSQYLQINVSRLWED